jgi:hypothetical protein
MTEIIDWQSAFNAVLTIAGAAISLYLRSLYKWNEQDHKALRASIEDLRSNQQSNAKDFRVDHVTCQQSLPNIYVPRAEYNATIAFIREALSEIREEIRKR